MGEGLVLARAAAMVAAVPHSPSEGIQMSITIVAKALITIDLLPAQCSDIDLADCVASGEERRYDMVFTPVHWDTLSSEPTVLIRATGLGEPAEIGLALELEFTNLRTERSVAVDHRFAPVCLTAQMPVARMRLPLNHLGIAGARSSM
ncbi:hypothetical protein [Mycobacterium sp.]|jgi:hypothetical protein|uniref:hypothetical protein n=1 Tax=Mycobacterium sp. TaxID=1785 RepID=UPI0028BE635B|nr:hypothetical protein [Mycobacterium sp.]